MKAEETQALMNFLVGKKFIISPSGTPEEGVAFIIERVFKSRTQFLIIPNRLLYWLKEVSITFEQAARLAAEGECEGADGMYFLRDAKEEEGE